MSKKPVFPERVPLFETPYWKAWQKFVVTTQYKSCVELMLQNGMKQPYIDNILRSAFDAGYENLNNATHAKETHKP